MILKKVTIAELPSFINSSVYKNSKNMPITKQRALSQFRNPNANENDTALIIAVENENIIGFIGLLPDKINIENSIKVFWNSCWWVDPISGKKTAMPLFFSFLKETEGLVMFRDMTNKTKQIIHKIGRFKELQKLNGIRFFLRFNFSEIMYNKLPFASSIANVFKPLDWILNLFVSRKQKPLKNIEVKFIDRVDDELGAFISKINSNEYIGRGQKELNWILDNKWIVESKEKPTNTPYYYFSNISKVFKNELIKVYDNNELIGFLFFTNNNGLFKLPYMYCNEKYLTVISKVISNYLIKRKAISFLTFNNKLIHQLNKDKFKSWHLKKVKKEFVVSKKLIPLLKEKFTLQDGDGDSVFT